MSLLPSDIPNLKSLQADPGIATSFLAVSAGLESMNLFHTVWDGTLFSKFQASSATRRSSLRHLTIQVWYSDKWLWDNLGEVFALFPKMETLDFTVIANTGGYRKVQPPKYFFEKIADQSHALQSLQSIEFQYVTFTGGCDGIERESVLLAQSGYSGARLRACLRIYHTQTEPFTYEPKIRAEIAIRVTKLMFASRKQSKAIDSQVLGSQHVTITKPQNNLNCVTSLRMDILTKTLSNAAKGHGKLEDSKGQRLLISLQDVPVEVLEQIVLALPMSAIPHMMVNKFLRPICEQCLYQRIQLWGRPRRSLRLLETFLLRPDLAQLVHYLAIDVSWVNGWGQASKEVPDGLKPDGAEALALCTKVQSLALDDYGNWVHRPEYARIRAVVSSMKLTSLTIPWLIDCPPEDEELGVPELENIYNRDRVAEVLELFQTQPLLEKLSIDSRDLSGELLSILQETLRSSDVPNLKQLQADSMLAIPFMSVAPGLESLHLTLSCDWSDKLLSRLETSSLVISSSIRHFAIEVMDDDNWLWDNLSRILNLFPKTETLCVIVSAGAATVALGPPMYYFQMISFDVHIPPAVRKMEFRFNAFHPVISEIRTEFIKHLKMVCPLLEAFVDHIQCLWAFQKSSGSSGEFFPTPVGRLEQPGLRQPVKDLPAPEVKK
ncbi:hypothetical protein FRC01_006508 [Tulasnella sp. 417]|nr:hypothetical protein FRC01_006508 [Tulasnella sp. 417]